MPAGGLSEPLSVSLSLSLFVFVARGTQGRQLDEAFAMSRGPASTASAATWVAESSIQANTYTHVAYVCMYVCMHACMYTYIHIIIVILIILIILIIPIILIIIVIIIILHTYILYIYADKWLGQMPMSKVKKFSIPRELNPSLHVCNCIRRGHTSQGFRHQRGQYVCEFLNTVV